MTNRTNVHLKTYQAWIDMKGRCDNPNNYAYKYYGERGISYEPSWNYYNNFLKDMGEAPATLTLDRINNNGNYTAKNCRWATRAEQGANRRTTLLTVGIVKIIKNTLNDFDSSISWRTKYTELGNAFGVTADAIRSIHRGKNWKSVE